VFRGIAAMLVALHHAATHIASYEPFKDGTKPFFVGRFLNTDAGMIGVDLFFVVSGFIMVYTTARGNVGPAKFLRKRVVRIYPLYWFFSLVVIGIHLTPWVGRIEADVPTLIKSFTLYPVYFPNLELLRPVLIPQGWTLTYEILFYLVFAATMRWRPGRQLVFVAAAFLAANVGANVLPLPHTPEVAVLRDSILLEFPLGMLLGYLVCHRGVRIGPRMAMATTAAAAILVVPYFLHWQAPRLFTLGVPAFLLIGGFALARDAETRRFPRWLVFLGDASYSIYLTHILVLLLFHTGYIRLPVLQSLPYDSYYVMLMAGIVAAGALSYWRVEKPLLEFFRKRTRSPRVATLAAITDRRSCGEAGRAPSGRRGA
jgi:peptidoglycan/LPS O-acetylase OafA/YrhL